MDKKMKLFILLLLLNLNAHAEIICSKEKKPQTPKELKIQENAFEFAAGKKALAKINTLVWRKLRQYKKTQEVINDTEGFGIPFPNYMRIGRGALLKERALHLKYKWLAKKAKKSEWEAARDEFCIFKNSSQYID